MSNNKSLEQKMIDALNEHVKIAGSLGAWELADIIWDNCMQKPQRGNGARIAHLRRCAQKSKRIVYFVDNNGEQRYMFAGNMKEKFKI